MNWEHKIDIKHHLNNYEEQKYSTLHQVYEGINNDLTVAFPTDDHLKICIMQLRDAADVGDIEEFDEAMEDLFQWADENKVWLGI